MFKNLKLGAKLILGFSGVAVITLILGLVGYYGMVQGERSIDEIGMVRLPSVGSLLVISEAQTAVDSSENALLSRDLDLQGRQGEYAEFADAWNRAEDAWRIYEPLPQTAEEAQAWRAFVPLWEQWKKDHEAYVALSREYDKTVEAQHRGAEIYARMSNQALVTNAASFGTSEALLNQIVEIYRTAGASKYNFTRDEFLAIGSLLTISEAQTAIDSAENALLDRSVNLEARQSQYARMADAWKRIETAWGVYEPLEKIGQETRLWNQFVPAWNAWRSDHRAFVTLSQAYDATVEGYHQGNAIYVRMGEQALNVNRASFAKSEELLNQIVQINRDIAAHEVEQARSQAAFLEAFLLIAAIIGVLLAMALGFLITRSITRPIHRIIAGLSTGSEEVASASQQVSSASQSLAEGASEQAASIEETSSSLEEMSSMTKQNAENANQARVRMDEAGQIVNKVNDHMNDMAAAIEEITKSSEETGKIIKTIDEIAFQTNLLALNAAVEAARAGEAGAGFAVVADEVRNLAMRAAEAAKNTSNLIENTIKSVKNGNTLTQSTREAYRENIEISQKVAELVQEISAASNEQAQGIEQVNKAVTEMDKVIQQNAGNAEESASASEELNAQAEQMMGMVNEMIALVGGGSGEKKTAQAGGSERHFRHETHAAHKPMAAQKTNGKESRPVSQAKKEAAPEKVIPFDDGDFKNF